MKDSRFKTKERPTMVRGVMILLLFAMIGVAIIFQAKPWQSHADTSDVDPHLQFCRTFYQVTLGETSSGSLAKYDACQTLDPQFKAYIQSLGFSYGTLSSTPTAVPSSTPGITPTIDPNSTPGITPTIDPDSTPTVTPTIDPYSTPGITPTIDPYSTPGITPTIDPDSTPTITPTIDPDSTPTVTPTVDPYSTPTVTPTIDPDSTPTITPTIDPDSTPTITPTETPTAVPQNWPATNLVSLMIPADQGKSISSISATDTKQVEDALTLYFQSHISADPEDAPIDQAAIDAWESDPLLQLALVTYSVDPTSQKASYVGSADSDTIMTPLVTFLQQNPAELKKIQTDLAKNLKDAKYTANGANCKFSSPILAQGFRSCLGSDSIVDILYAENSTPGTSPTVAYTKAILVTEHEYDYQVKVFVKANKASASGEKAQDAINTLTTISDKKLFDTYIDHILTTTVEGTPTPTPTPTPTSTGIPATPASTPTGIPATPTAIPATPTSTGI